MASDALERLKARREAPYHVQVEITAAPVVGSAGDAARVEGRVVSVFRTDGRIGAGDQVTFHLPVTRGEGEAPPGPASISYERLARATHIEAFLGGDPPHCELRLDEYELIPAAGPAPTMSAERLG